jgi:hypothetical protein
MCEKPLPDLGGQGNPNAIPKTATCDLRLLGAHQAMLELGGTPTVLAQSEAKHAHGFDM